MFLVLLFLLFCFVLFCFFFQLGPYCSDFIFDIWLGPEKLWDFKSEKRALGVGSCLSLYSEREREENSKGKKNVTDALFVFERKKIGEQQGFFGSRIFYESLARYMFVKLKRLKNQVNISATFMKPFIKENCAIFKLHKKNVRKRLF